MGTRSIVETLSDLSGEKADRNVTFTVGSMRYEIDLTDAEAHEFLELLQPYIAAARKLGRG